MDTDIEKYTHDLNNRMIEQLKLESSKGLNRMICIVREYGREFDKHYKNDTRVKQGWFIKLVKRVLIEASESDVERQAFSHL